MTSFPDRDARWTGPSSWFFAPTVASRAALVALVSLTILIGGLRQTQANDGAATPTREVRSGNRLGGLFTIDDDRIGRWPVSGAWMFPVGDPREPERPVGGVAGYTVNRGIERSSKGAITHQGVDLCNRRAGGTVRAAANGIVVRAGPGDGNGYGVHVVLAHRLESGSLAYSVYGHLANGSLEVRTGSNVRWGQPIGQVGRTGRASTDHLHFEIRMARETDQRWEKATPIDPVSFVSDHLPGDWAVPAEWTDPAVLGRYLEWAEFSGLVHADAAASESIQRVTWWRILARAVRDPLDRLPSEPERLRSDLIEIGILPESTVSDGGKRLPWTELARDLARLRELGLCLAPPSLSEAEHRSACESRLGSKHPARRLDDLGDHSRHSPNLVDACVALADLSLDITAEQTAATSRSGR